MENVQSHEDAYRTLAAASKIDKRYRANRRFAKVLIAAVASGLRSGGPTALLVNLAHGG